MSGQFDLAQTLFAGGVDHPNSSAAKSNVKPLLDGVVAQVVGISLKIEYDRRTIRFTVEESNSPIFAASDCDRAEIIEERNSLRLAETSDAVHYFVRFQVDHFNRVIAQ